MSSAYFWKNVIFVEEETEKQRIWVHIFQKKRVFWAGNRDAKKTTLHFWRKNVILVRGIDAKRGRIQITYSIFYPNGDGHASIYDKLRTGQI